MLGEAAMTQADADRYFNDYLHAIESVGKDAAGRTIYNGNSVSVKLLLSIQNIGVRNMIVLSTSFIRA